MKKEKLFSKLQKRVEAIKDNSSESFEVLRNVASLLRKEIEYYDWVGFYLADRNEKELVLGPYEGEPTEHDRIDYGKGICGQSAETKETFTVQDVEKESNPFPVVRKLSPKSSSLYLKRVKLSEKST